MALAPNRLHDCHIFSLPSQGSVYTLCRLPSNLSCNRTRLLVASLRKPIYLLEFNQGFKLSLVPYYKELSFTSVAGHTEVVSITSFTKSGSSNIIIGATCIKVGNNERGQFLNIYTLRDHGIELNADGLVSSCSLEINFVPYHLTYTTADEVYLVLSGSDNRVHVYGEDPSKTHCIVEKEPDENFPEFIEEFPSVVLWIEFFVIQEKNLRLTSVGCECGSLYLFKVDTQSKNLISTCHSNHGSSITSSKFFQMDQSLHLLVTNALLPASVYSNVIENGLNISTCLPGSERHDVVTCSLVCDIHMNQQPTILLGTYGQELLAYKYCPDSLWIPAWQRSFSHPILSLDYCDVTGDGVCELVAFTTRGVQILQHDLKEVAQLLLTRLGLISD